MYKNVYFWYFNKDGEFEFSESGTAPIEVISESPAIRINKNEGVPPQYVVTEYDVYDLVCLIGNRCSKVWISFQPHLWVGNFLNII